MQTGQYFIHSNKPFSSVQDLVNYYAVNPINAEAMTMLVNPIVVEENYVVMEKGECDWGGAKEVGWMEEEREEMKKLVNKTSTVESDSNSTPHMCGRIFNGLGTIPPYRGGGGGHPEEWSQAT